MIKLSFSNAIQSGYVVTPQPMRQWVELTLNNWHCNSKEVVTEGLPKVEYHTFNYIKSLLINFLRGNR